MSKRILLIPLFLVALIHSAQENQNATLRVRIADREVRRSIPARVLLLDEQGDAVTAVEGVVAAMWGRQDRAEGFAFQPDGAFYVDGEFSAIVPPGAYEISVSKGYEFIPQRQTIRLDAGQNLRAEYFLDRWIDMPDRGWYSADDHIHVQRSPRTDRHLLRWMAAEDIHVGNILEMGDFWATFFSQYSFGDAGRYREEDYILSSGQEEPRTPEIGHTISLGADELVRFPRDYYNYGRVFDRVHELGGVSGYAHQGASFHGYRGMTLDAIRGRLDFLELAQFCVPGGPIITEHYYHFLDLGIPLTALAGSDFPWCGRGPRFGLESGHSQIGDARFYTYVGDQFTFDRWLAAVKAGHTFATTGPIVELEVNDRLPGDTIDVSAGATVHVRATARGHREVVPLSELEIVVHGEVIKRTSGSPEELTIDMALPVERGIWIAARAAAGRLQAAHTTPVYVTVNGEGFHNPKTAPRYLELSEKYLQEIEAELANPGNALDNQAWRHRQGLENLIAETREELRLLSSRLGVPMR